MVAKKIEQNEDALKLIKDGVSKLARAVKTTLGPQGRNVIIQKSFGSPIVTRDGVAVAKEIDLPNNYENMGAQLVKEVAQKTSAQAGDGTTTATVLAEAIFLEGLKNVTAGANIIPLKNGIIKASQSVINFLKSISITVKSRTDIENVAAISANNDFEIGGILADAIDKVGKDGAITIEDGKSFETRIETVNGLEIDKGYISSHFITHRERLECILDEPYILIHEKKLSSGKDVLPILEKVAQSGSPLLVISDDIEGEALAILVVNHLNRSLTCCAVKSPAFGERKKAILQDIAVLTGGKAILEDIGVELTKIDFSYLGKAEQVKITKENTIIIEGKGDKNKIKSRINQLKRELEQTTSDYDREKLQERISKLSGGVAKILVGYATESELKEKKARFEDALHATRSAIEEGIIPGGGVALLRAQKSIQELKLEAEEKIGANILANALLAPTKQICQNAGYDGSVIVEKILQSNDINYGFDAHKEEFTDMFKNGIVDPTKVTRLAIENAVSVATLLLTTNALVGDIPEEKEKEKEHHHYPPEY